MERLLELAGISKSYSQAGLLTRRTSMKALDDIHLTVHKGEILAILGESGSGKSTLARILTRLDRADSGSLRSEGQELGPKFDRKAYGARVQMIFQDPFASLNPAHTVGYHIMRPLKLHKPQLTPSEIEREAFRLLNAVGLRPALSFRDKFPFELSGGQRQRAAIARALTVEPEILIADEPTSMLDVSIRMDILNLIKGLRESRGLSIVLITHDLPSAWYLRDRVVVLYAGQIVESGTSASILQRPAHPYTQLLLQVSPQKILQPGQGWRSPHKTQALGRSSQGCQFAARCSRSISNCHVTAPVLENIGSDRQVRCFQPFTSSDRKVLDA